MRTDADFSEAIARALSQMRTAPIVHTQRWQGIDISNKPEMATHEMRHFFMDVPILTESLVMLRKQIEPNLPWADDHFAERVCGQPINPGVQWAKWPYAHSADRFRQPVLGPILPPQDWAYLAGMIDGDGTIYFRDQERWQGVVRVYQRDRDICDQLHRLFRVGKVTSNNEDTETELPDGRVVNNHCFYWQVNAVLECRWLLSGVLPYLRIKQNRAEQALSLISNSIRSPKIGSPQKKVWDRDWEPRYNHNYMSRYWPRGDNDSPYLGYDGNKYGDLHDVVDQLEREPQTRQAILPVFFPEDTGAVHGGRVPCSLFYQFMVRDRRLDITYVLRSCDMLRHFRDDIYMTVRLALWVLDRLRERNKEWTTIRPGRFVMLVTSLHCFRNDYYTLFPPRV